MTEKYKTKRIIDRKPPLRTVIVDENGKVINKNPTIEELKGLKWFDKELYLGNVKKPVYYNETNTCDNCREEGIETKLIPGKTIREHNKKGELTGNWLCNKCKSKDYGGIKVKKRYTDEELLEYIIQFYEKYGRIPIAKDFSNNSEYPNFSTYQTRFGSWLNALKLAGLDIDLTGRQGDQYRGRVAEIKVINHFKQYPIDLSGENRLSPCDGICPNGKTYDVKGSKLHENTKYKFNTNNKYKEEIEIYYFLAFNFDWSKLEYVWRVPGEIVEGTIFYIGLNSNYKFNIENMKEYDITYKFKDLLF